ncbi:MAG: hypothetical protein OXF79_28020 [Chloroflexi bacterium]|nr:hypothetical protein [Chloroflexota bacterium]
MSSRDELVEQLESAHSAGSYETATRIAEALGKSGYSGAVEPLIVALGVQDYEGRKAEGIAIPLRGPEVKKAQFRESVTTALGLLGDRRAIRPLINALHDHPAVSARAVEALSEFAFNDIEQQINCALQNGNEYIQKNAVRVLAKTAAGNAVVPIIELLQGGNSRVRSVAAETLGDLSDTRAVNPPYSGARG